MRRSVVVTFGVVLMVAAGCGGDDSDRDDEQAATATTSETTSGDGNGDGDADDGVGNSPSSDSSPGQAPVTDPAEVAARLQGAGLGCQDYAEREPGGTGPGYGIRAGSCTLSDGVNVTVEMFDNEDGLAAYVTAGEQYSCPYFSGLDLNYVTGAWWAISPSADPSDAAKIAAANDTLQRAAQAINETVGTMHC